MRSADVRALAEATRLARSGEGRKIREAAGVPLSAVAEVVGVSGPTVSRWELGQRRPTGARAAAWVRLLRRLRDDAAASE